MWLVKTEPSQYSFAELERDGRTTWDGVRNPAAVRHLRSMKTGDRVLVYHTGDEKAIVGLAEVVREAYADPKTRGVVVDVRARGRVARPVTLAEIRGMPEFATSPLVRQGRLSVVPLSVAQWGALEARWRR
jgi:predicted RNA-binding protein with PUA-like domain